MKIKCEYCDSLFDSTLEICPHCGGAASEHPIAQSEPITTPISAKDDKRIRDAQLENMRLQNEKDREGLKFLQNISLLSKIGRYGCIIPIVLLIIALIALIVYFIASITNNFDSIMQFFKGGMWHFLN